MSLYVVLSVVIVLGVFGVVFWYYFEKAKKYRSLYRDTLNLLTDERKFRDLNYNYAKIAEENNAQANKIIEKIGKKVLTDTELNDMRSGLLPKTTII
jgi:hypothetical protein